jgi:hypothetical protein
VLEVMYKREGSAIIDVISLYREINPFGTGGEEAVGWNGKRNPGYWGSHGGQDCLVLTLKHTVLMLILTGF